MHQLVYWSAIDCQSTSKICRTAAGHSVNLVLQGTNYYTESSTGCLTSELMNKPLSSTSCLYTCTRCAPSATGYSATQEKEVEMVCNTMGMATRLFFGPSVTQLTSS